MSILSLPFLLALGIAFTWPGADLFRRVDGRGAVNWTRRIILATGHGQPEPTATQAVQRAGALRAARLDAARQVLEIVDGLRLDASSRVNQFVAKAKPSSEALRVRIEGVVKGLKEIEAPRYFEDGVVEVETEVPLAPFLELLLPAPPPQKPPGREIPGEPYTAVIVDGRGLGGEPGLAPKLLSEKGRVLYGLAFLDRRLAVEQGVVEYVDTPEAALNTERAGARPYVVKAIKVSGTERTDLILSEKDAQQFLRLPGLLRIIKGGRVFFVLE